MARPCSRSSENPVKVHAVIWSGAVSSRTDFPLLSTLNDSKNHVFWNLTSFLAPTSAAGFEMTVGVLPLSSFPVYTIQHDKF